MFLTCITSTGLSHSLSIMEMDEALDSSNDGEKNPLGKPGNERFIKSRRLSCKTLVKMNSKQLTNRFIDVTKSAAFSGYSPLTQTNKHQHTSNNF